MREVFCLEGGRDALGVLPRKNPGWGRLPAEESAMHHHVFPISRSAPVSGGAPSPSRARHPPPRAAHSPPPTGRHPSKQPATRAQRQHVKPRHRVSCGRPPARPPATGISNLVKFPRSCSATGQENRSSSGRRPGRWATSMRPTESEGSRRQAATRMRMGQSGAKAPDRNRGRPPPGPPARRAAYEARRNPSKSPANRTVKQRLLQPPAPPAPHTGNPTPATTHPSPESPPPPPSPAPAPASHRCG